MVYPLGALRRPSFFPPSFAAMFRISNVERWQWIAAFVFRSVKNRAFLPQPPGTDLRWSGKQMTIHPLKGPYRAMAQTTTPLLTSRRAGYVLVGTVDALNSSV